MTQMYGWSMSKKIFKRLRPEWVEFVENLDEGDPEIIINQDKYFCY